MKAARWLWIVVLLCVGCGVRGRHVDFARYEPSDDSFIHLHSWTNIPLEGERDQDRLQSIYERREELLVLPYVLLDAPAIERKGRRTYQWTGLESDRSTPTAKDPVIDFDSIRIAPGVLYQDEQKRLGYFHSEVIPGETMTAIVAAAFSALADHLAEGHLGPATAAKGRSISWDDFRQSMCYHLDQMAGIKDSPKPKHDSGDLPFDATTLKMWSGAAIQRPFKVSRLRDEFVMIAPMSAEDAQESLATFQVYRDKWAQLVKDGHPMEPFREGTEAFSMKAADGRGLEITFQFSKLAHVWNELSRAHLAEPLDVTKSGKEKYEAQVFAILERGISIAPRKSIDDLVAEFFR